MTTQPQPGFWDALSSVYRTIISIAAAAEVAAITMEKGVRLAENEVDNLSILQQQRISQSQADLAKLNEELSL